MYRNLSEQFKRSHDPDYIVRVMRMNYNAYNGLSRFSHIRDYSRLQHEKERYQDFGILFNTAIKSGSIRETLRLINTNNIPANGGWTAILEDHFNEEFYCCDDCDNIFRLDDTTYLDYEDRRVCFDCESNYDEEPEEDRSYEHIGGRHSSKRQLGHIPSAYDQRKPRVLMGLELELEIEDDYDLDNKAAYILDHIGTYRSPDGNNHKYALIEEDCSIDRGFEIVTGYTGLDVHKEQLKFFKGRLHGALSHKTDTCGLHIHICKSDMTMLHASKLILFMNDPANEDLIFALARRRNNGYCKQKDLSNRDYLKHSLEYRTRSDQLCSLNSDRYERLNFQNDRTIEYRLFRGTLKYSTIMACLEFTYATWFFAKSASPSQLNVARFLHFICEPENRLDTRFLRTYLKSKGFVMPYEPNLKKAA